MPLALDAPGQAFVSGLALSLSLIMALGPQNAHVLRAGMLRQHLGLTVAVCAASDALLIALGVAALARLGQLSPLLMALLLAGGAAFLMMYSARALVRCLRPQAVDLGAPAGPVSRASAFAQVMAFTWLNPHAWLDTAVLIGTASLAQPAPLNWVFGAGAAAGSALWFVLLGSAAALAGRRLQGPRVVRLLDGAVALLCAQAAWGLLRALPGLNA